MITEEKDKIGFLRTFSLFEKSLFCIFSCLLFTQNSFSTGFKTPEVYEKVGKSEKADFILYKNNFGDFKEIWNNLNNNNRKEIDNLFAFVNNVSKTELKNQRNSANQPTTRRKIVQLTREELLQSIEDHNKAVLVLRQQMRDPHLELSPDGYYYLSCTRSLQYFPDELPATQSWRSTNLVDWEDLGVIWEAKNSVFGRELIDAATKREIIPAIWGPEFHFVDGKWVIIYTSNMRMANLMLTTGSELKAPYVEPMPLTFGFFRDPTLFVDDDGTPWLISECAEIRRLRKDFSGFQGYHKLLNPQDRKLGHEGTYIIKFQNKYVLFGTGWSTDIMRKGTYNLYYCTSDNVTGPYGPRKFAGRFLGHGSPFQDKDGRWWCTAFNNASNAPIDPPEDARNMDLSGSAYTINKQGLTLVPLEIRMVNGDVEIYAKDENYRYPGSEEHQQF